MVTIFDTSIVSKNTGDYIIMDSINRELNKIFINCKILHTYTHDKISTSSYKLIKKSNYSFVGGTNLLSSNMNIYNQWKINLIDTLFLNDVILFGVGWWQYQNKPNAYTKYLLKSVLSNNVIHSVRSFYTKKMLSKIGIDNVINTGCPTMWDLTPAHCKNIPTTKGESVVFTLTDYNKDLLKDQKFIDILIRNYNEIYFWPQGSDDLSYLHGFKNINKIKVINGNLINYDDFLKSHKSGLDYVGTRLHAGIRALQYFKRTIIIGIDNRASEKSKDFKLTVVSRNEIDNLDEIIKSSFKTNLTIDLPAIDKWRNQFKSMAKNAI